MRSRASGEALIALAFLVFAAAIFAAPTMMFVAQDSWASEQGGHGPIVMATGLWLLARKWPEALAVAKRPPLGPPVLLLVLALVGTALARITQIVEIEGYLMYAALLAGLYSLVGLRAVGKLWFPLVYLAFMFPPPETVVWAITFPMKMWVSEAAVWLLALLGYPIAGQGVAIFVGQYELLVAAACSGLNSVVSLSAITLFYIYLRHEADWRYALLLALLVVPVALFGNFVRVLILILLTYHAGEAAAQGFLHNFAGMIVFVVALLAIFGIDELLKPLLRHRGGV